MSDVGSNDGGLSDGTVVAGGESAYINDKAYAMTGNSVTGNNVTYGGTGTLGNAATSYSSSALVTGSFARANTPNAAPDMQCVNCEYVQWGVWAMKTDVGGRIDTALIPYVAGKMTTDLSLIPVNMGAGTLPLTASYNGPVIGSQFNGTGLANVSGNFTADINFTSRTVEGFHGNLGSQQFLMSGGPVNIDLSGPALFNNINLAGNHGITNGSARGALFGGLAENIGGSLKYEVSGGGGSGVFLGAR
jgi:hypothetical protein